MSGTLNLNNTERIICDSIFLTRDGDIINRYDIVLSKGDAADIVGLPPDTLNTLQEIANSMGNDADFFGTINTRITLKRNISDNYDNIYIDNLITNYYTKTRNTHKPDFQIRCVSY